MTFKQEFYRPRELSDVAVGNDKTLTADTEAIGTVLEVLAFTYTATSDAGTRSVDVVIYNAAGQELVRLVDVIEPTLSQVVSAYIYPGSGDGELPPFVFRPGWEIQVVDEADIEPTDTLEVWAYFEGTDVIG